MTRMQGRSGAAPRGRRRARSCSRTPSSAAARPPAASGTSRVGGVATVPPRCSTASTTSRSATCTGRRRSPTGCATAARRCRTRSASAAPQGGVAGRPRRGGLREVRRPTAGGARAQPAHRHARGAARRPDHSRRPRQHFVSALLTDPVRPADADARSCASGSRTACTWSGPAGRAADGRATGSGCAAAATSRSPTSSSTDVRSEPASGETRLLEQALSCCGPGPAPRPSPRRTTA